MNPTTNNPATGSKWINPPLLPGNVVYLAARYSRRLEVISYREELEEWGYAVQARWLSGDHQLEDNGAPVGETANQSLEDVNVADIVILFTEPPRSKRNRGGRHVAFGMALANNARVIVVGYRENIFHWLPCVEFYPTWAAASAVLKTVVR